MANKNFKGVLRDPLGEFAYKDRFKFTHVSTTGEVIRGSISALNIPENGAYDIDIEYGNVLIESRDRASSQWTRHGVVTINQDTVVTTLPALLQAAVPATPELVLQLEQILSEAEDAADRAEVYALAAKNQVTTQQLINNYFDFIEVGDSIATTGFYENGDGGGGTWVLTNGLDDPSKTPLQFGAVNISDSSGRVFTLTEVAFIDPHCIGQTSGVKGDFLSQIALNHAIEKKIPFKLTGEITYSAPESEGTACLELPFDSNLDVEIFGNSSTNIIMEDNTSHGFGYTGFIGNSEGLRYLPETRLRGGGGKLYVHDLKINGSWVDGGQSERYGRNVFACSRLDRFEVKRVKAYNLQNKLFRGGWHKRYVAMFNELEICASDGFRAQESESCTVSFNKIKYCDDDAIALHSEKTSTDIDSPSRVIIQGNIIEDSEGIACGGAKIISVTGNILSRTHGTCILIVTSPSPQAPEGQTTVHDISVSGNVITDPLTRVVGSSFSATTETQGAISIGGSMLSYGPSGVTPTVPDSTGNIAEDYAKLDGVNAQYVVDLSINASSGARAISINSNTISRTLPNGSYSSNGYGEYMDRGGFKDPVINEDSFLYSGIVFTNDISNMSVSNNTISGMYHSGVRFRAVNTDSNPNTMQYRNVIVSDNIVFNCLQGVSTNVANAPITFNWDLNIIGNTFDCDPYLKDVNRNQNGTWGLNSNNNTSCFGISNRNIPGATISGNTFKNCYKPLSTLQNETTNPLQGYSGVGNTVYCNPVSIEYNADNGGVGIPGSGASFSHIIYETDPTSSDYGKLITNPNNVENSIPTSGTFVQGHSFALGNPQISGQYMITGAVRVTTGSSNAIGTDWVWIKQDTTI